MSVESANGRVVTMLGDIMENGVMLARLAMFMHVEGLAACTLRAGRIK
jgi:hypothetical protein